MQYLPYGGLSCPDVIEDDLTVQTQGCVSRVHEIIAIVREPTRSNRRPCPKIRHFLSSLNVPQSCRVVCRACKHLRCILYSTTSRKQTITINNISICYGTTEGYGLHQCTTQLRHGHCRCLVSLHLLRNRHWVYCLWLL